ncbi:hypothetical protein LTR62_007790 [Meristemomyces frigidus]|uniref:Transcription factor domain-containing protein n=1 Tax=Meristemomyces frigidus TaxID=1508187 RepID=A0AAN7TLQ7_9PEZI|nr:hypothetical protein LTR62_007790 [Meristemomyces frigidus]
MDKLMHYMQTHAAGLQHMTVQIGAISSRLQHVEEVCKSLSSHTEQEVATEVILKPQLDLDDHRTAPHHLMRHWPSIHPILQAANVQCSDNYVRELEDRPILSFYTAGEAYDQDTVSNGRSDSPSSLDDAVGSSPIMPRATSTGLPDWSDVAPDGTLKLDVATINALVDSYVKHIHIMHPFLNIRRLRAVVAEFAKARNTRKRSNEDAEAGRTDTSGKQGVARPSKRRRDHVIYEGPRPESAELDVSFQQHAVERTAQIAVVYLVLALGKICLHRSRVATPEQRSTTPPSTASSFASADSSYSQAVSRRGSVQFAATTGLSKRKLASGSTECLQPNRLSCWDPQTKTTTMSTSANVYRVPGLAYYARAAEILGEHSDGNDLIHAQMFLLAGLYKGQLARVGESMSWITKASRVAMILLERFKLYTNYWTENGDVRKQLAKGQARITDRQVNLIVLVSWSCLQLESDILADLPYPSSGIQSAENFLLMPHSGREADSEADEQFPDHEHWEDYDNTMIYYTAQLFLRRKLNQVHREMYGSGCLHQPLDHVRDMLGSYESLLYSWRESLPVGYKWDDRDPPATCKLAARLRAKYYGARYLVNRPYLDYALHIMPGVQSGRTVREIAKDVHGAPRHAADIHIFEAIWQMPEAEILQACKRCIEAAMQSTTALDGVPEDEMIVTNIHGTAHAQFGNMLVLAAAYYSKHLNSLVPATRFKTLLERTIAFTGKAAGFSPTCKVDSEILEDLHWTLFGVSGHLS